MFFSELRSALGHILNRIKKLEYQVFHTQAQVLLTYRYRRMLKEIFHQITFQYKKIE